jgi:hypothetical protein
MALVQRDLPLALPPEPRHISPDRHVNRSQVHASAPPDSHRYADLPTRKILPRLTSQSVY